ncbi:uncharacterized protein BDR25DRAFT_323719 [Lindgomyces ingoldianus]|uniref:Uncharacterized protein n=1 Tax=Lindgomyces ingoldianus TaxID=673940 RepID=A0ACB6R3L1_9PLEO|nr:uncharacterized protein BDR25DRAFT_323719 [Lindgomyces ingoldianus]KAF2473097.1 hypothetical protein BDR25DRAFT_323719 [Lindgomyces ingoldianus]
MNRFLTRKKDRVLDDNASGGKKSKKGKKSQPEPKIELDITAALPASDNFRTSLIMPSLSTRFSMLREQDDPSSKLGKASDDSVLLPKRQSRLHEFGFVPGGLSDIAEVSSLNGSVSGSARPPFANERQNSFDSHNAEEGGSMMSRARPGEGNVLFGGRQKIYKISNTGSSKSLGRALYEDDVSMSTFQKIRAQERERARVQMEGQEKADDDQQSEPSSPTKELAYSPSLSGYSQRRETSSSTNSGTANTRSSTAATSIASQGANAVPASSPALPSSTTATSPTTETPPLNRTTTKARRLYETGLDQHIYEQQSSAMNRLNSIQRTRAPTGRSTPPLLYTQTRSATSLNDRFNRTTPFRTESPTQMANAAIPNGKDTHSSNSSPVVSRPQSPPLNSPLASDSDEAQTLHSALQPNDRGKATAMGAFNKPKQAFSEQQYAERLKRLQQEREASMPKLDKPSKPSLRERAELEQRKRAEAGTNERQWSNTAEKREAPSAFSVFQSAANQMKSPATTTGSTLKSDPSAHSVQSPDSQTGATFFASPGSSEDEDEGPKKPIDLSRRLQNIPTTNKPAPPILQHPALRSRSNSRVEKQEHPSLQSHSQSRPAPTQQSHDPPPSTNGSLQPNSTTKSSDDLDIDSPTLGPNNGGLSGLVRQHLRNVSNVSSDYGEFNQIAMSPPYTSTATAPLSLRTQELGVQRRQPTSESDTPAHSSYSHSNPWDLDDIDNPYYGEGDSISSVSPVDAHKVKPVTNVNPPTSNSQSTERSPSHDDTPQWEKDMKKSHQRGASTETQDEREAFKRELAQRQRAVQESLGMKVSQDNNRSVSPAPSAGAGGLKNALNMLRSKSSRESFATNSDIRPQEGLPPTKAMRMLGIGTGSANASSTSLAGQNDRFHGNDHWRADEDRMGRGLASRPKPTRVLEQSEQDARRELEQRLQRSATDDVTHHAKPKGRSPPASSKSSTRNRSSSELSSGRSRSRGGRYRDDLEQAMVEGTGSRSTVYPLNNTPSMSGYAINPTQPVPADRPSLDSQSSRMRSRSNSRTTGYFESKHLQPIQTGHGHMNGAPPRLSPAANSPKPQFSPGLPASPRPSPGAPSPNMNVFRPQASPVPAFSANNTPPVSGTTTPVTPGFNHPNPNSSGPTQKPGMQVLRKKSIAKTDISEPIFLSATSVMDTVDLPAGASLKNGMDPPPPPVPPINPMRRRFGFGRTEQHDSYVQPPHTPFTESQRTNSSDALSSQANPISEARQRLRKTSSEGRNLHGKAQTQGAGSPAMPSTPFGRNGSPPRPINSRHIAQRPMDGAMF